MSTRQLLRGQLLRGNLSRTGTLYLAVGILSLVKAIVVRNDRTRFRRELFDAALYIGLGLVLRRLGRIQAESEAAISERIPDWVQTEGEPTGVQGEVMRRLGVAPEPTPTMRDRARSFVPLGD